MEAYAEELGVPVEAVRCAIPDNRQCLSKNCDNIALKGNYQKCAECLKQWYPRLEPNSTVSASSSSSSSISYAVHGELLLGPRFMRYAEDRINKCSCGKIECIRIGYAHDGLYCLPSNKERRQNWFTALGMRHSAEDTSLDMNRRPDKYGIAYWHFDPERRRQDTSCLLYTSDAADD